MLLFAAIVINMETHGWSICRELETEDCSGLNGGIYVKPFLSSQRQGVITRKLFSGHDRAGAHMNAQK